MRISLIICVLACFATANANLITNGSFESPAVAAGSFEDFPSGSTLIPGWTVVGAPGGVSFVSGTYFQECCFFPAEDGFQWLDLTGDGTNSVEGVQQTVATTPGTEYNLSFWVGNVYDPGGLFGTTSTVDVMLGGLDGSSLGAFTNDSTTTGTQVWEKFTTSFTATGSSTTLDFLNADPAGDNSNGLDNINLTAVPKGALLVAPDVMNSVPEPATLPLLVMGLIGFGFLRRQKGRSG